MGPGQPPSSGSNRPAVGGAEREGQRGERGEHVERARERPPPAGHERDGDRERRAEEDRRPREERQERDGGAERGARAERGADHGAREEERDEPAEDERRRAPGGERRRRGTRERDARRGDPEQRREQRGGDRGDLAELVPGRVEERQRARREPCGKKDDCARPHGGASGERARDVERTCHVGLDIGVVANYRPATAPG